MAAFAGVPCPSTVNTCTESSWAKEDQLPCTKLTISPRLNLSLVESAGLPADSVTEDPEEDFLLGLEARPLSEVG